MKFLKLLGGALAVAVLATPLSVSGPALANPKNALDARTMRSGVFDSAIK